MALPAARLGYRKRAVLAADHDAGRWRPGLRRRDLPIAIPDCPMHSTRVNRCVAALSERLPAPTTSIHWHG